MPIQAWSYNPPILIILNQISPLLHTAQHLDGEQGVALSLTVQRLPKFDIQAIGFAVQEALDKLPAFGYLAGGSPFIALNFSDGEYRTAYLLG
jgi:hypothetical protein